jgi:hypothetical protein
MNTFTNVPAEELRVNDIIRVLVPDLLNRSGNSFVYEIVQITKIVPCWGMSSKTMEITFMSHAGEQIQYEPEWFPIQRSRA